MVFVVWGLDLVSFALWSLYLLVYFVGCGLFFPFVMRYIAGVILTFSLYVMRMRVASFVYSVV